MNEIAIETYSHEEDASDSGASNPDDDNSEDDFIPPGQQKKPEFYIQESLNNLIKDTGLPKDAAENLAPDLKKRNLVTKRTQFTLYYQTRGKVFLKFFFRDTDLVYCSDVIGIMNKRKPNIYKDKEWRLFIDSSQRSLKAVLIHNKNKFASMPIAHSTMLKESYMNIEKVLSVTKYSAHNWKL